MGSAMKGSSGKGLVVRAEEVEVIKALEDCCVLEGEELGFVSLPSKLVTFSSFLGLPMVGFEKRN